MHLFLTLFEFFVCQAAAEAGLGADRPLSEEEEAEEPVQLALVGRPNVGKGDNSSQSVDRWVPPKTREREKRDAGARGSSPPPQTSNAMTVVGIGYANVSSRHRGKKPADVCPSAVFIACVFGSACMTTAVF